MENKARLLRFSRELRKQMTAEERHLWYDFLKKLPLTVNRQKILGNYIVDFFIAAEKTVIELDGSQHYVGTVVQSDRDRDAWMQKNGITVLRYTNRQINEEFDAVCSDILRRLHIQSE